MKGVCLSTDNPFNMGVGCIQRNVVLHQILGIHRLAKSARLRAAASAKELSALPSRTSICPILDIHFACILSLVVR